MSNGRKDHRTQSSGAAFNRQQGQSQSFRSGGAGPAAGTSGQDSLEKILSSSAKIEFFRDPQRSALRSELLDQEADNTAKKISKIAPSQLRRFFHSLMSIHRRMEIDEDFRNNQDAIKAELAFLKASVAYTAKRLNWKNDELELVRLFTKARNSVQDAKDFNAFARHFEAIVAFHKVYGNERERDR